MWTVINVSSRAHIEATSIVFTHWMSILASDWLWWCVGGNLLRQRSTEIEIDPTEL